MKKFLLTLTAASMCVASCFADEVYGTTPQTAKPLPTGGWFVENLATAPAEAWFTFTSTATAPAMWGDGAADPTNPQLGQQVCVYLCDGGQQAFQMTEGSDSYVLFPGQEYLVKITPKAAGFFCMNPPLALPAAKFEGKQKYYPFVTTSEDWKNVKTIEAGTTAWYQLDVPYPTQLNIMDGAMPWMQLMNGITNIEAIHIECPGGTNEGDLIAGPYLKAGKNVIGITAAADLQAPLEFAFSYNAMVTLNCGNNLLRGSSLALDAKNTYPDAYYTVDRYFKVPEDGTYTFTNHGAKGTILNVGMVKLTDPANQYAFECDWSNIKSATVGNEDAVIVVSDLKKDDLVLVQSDSFGVIGAGAADLPYLMVTKGDSSMVSEIAAEGNSLKINAANGKLTVESVLLASGAEVAVYDMLANKVASTIAADGASSVEMALDATPGVYVVVVYGKGNSESAKIVVK